MQGDLQLPRRAAGSLLEFQLQTALGLRAESVVQIDTAAKQLRMLQHQGAGKALLEFGIKIRGCGRRGDHPKPRSHR